MKFKVGDRVRVVKAFRREYLGAVGTVATGLVTRTVNGKTSKWHEVEVDGVGSIDPTSGLPFCAKPGQLRLIDDDFRASSWDEICALTRGWRPGVVTCG